MKSKSHFKIQYFIDTTFIESKHRRCGWDSQGLLFLSSLPSPRLLPHLYSGHFPGGEEKMLPPPRGPPSTPLAPPGLHHCRAAPPAPPPPWRWGSNRDLLWLPLNVRPGRDGRDAACTVKPQLPHPLPATCLTGPSEKRQNKAAGLDICWENTGICNTDGFILLIKISEVNSRAKAKQLIIYISFQLITYSPLFFALLKSFKVKKLSR